MQKRSLFTRNLTKTNAHLYFARDRLYSTNPMLQKRFVGKRKIDQLIAKIVGNGADLSLDC